MLNDHDITNARCFGELRETILLMALFGFGLDYAGVWMPFDAGRWLGVADIVSITMDKLRLCSSFVQSFSLMNSKLNHEQKIIGLVNFVCHFSTTITKR